MVLNVGRGNPLFLKDRGELRRGAARGELNSRCVHELFIHLTEATTENGA